MIPAKTVLHNSSLISMPNLAVNTLEMQKTPKVYSNTIKLKCNTENIKNDKVKILENFSCTAESQ